jgi:phosphomannomutase
MRRAEVLQGLRRMKFEDVYGRWQQRRLSQAEAAEILGMSERTLRRWRDRYEDGRVAGLLDRRLGKASARGVPAGDKMMQILAAEALARKPGRPILTDVKASQALFDEIARLGGKPVMWKTGHSLMKSAMVEMAAPLAGEMSGHIFYADGFYGHDDALYVAIRLLAILAQDDRTLADWRDRMAPMVNTPELRFDCPDEEKFGVIDRVKAKLAAEGAEVNAIDGVRVLTEDGWWLLRASNTQAVLVARAEARDPAALTRLKQQLATNLEAAGVTPPAF